MGERGVDHLTRRIRLLRGPVPEARPEPMQHGGDAEFFDHLAQRCIGKRLSTRVGDTRNLLSEVGGVAIKPFLKEFWDGSSNRPQVFPKSSAIDVDFMCRVRMVVCFVSFGPSELE